jgi:ssDNA-binding Zn-finger/Zn-ribbon topoisomerase 1
MRMGDKPMTSIANPPTRESIKVRNERRKAAERREQEGSPCPACHGSGTIAIWATTGRYAFPGPVPEDARGVAEARCHECGIPA